MGLYLAVHLTTKVKLVERAEALDSAEATLHNAGFKISRRCTSRTSCFDFAARKEEKFIFVKVLLDIRGVSRSDAVELKTVSRCLNCSSLIISDMSGEETLSDDTIYSRYGVYVATSKTLEDVVRGTYPLIEATPGGYFVRIDGNKIRESRHEIGLSIGKLAGMAGISRRALYGYEQEMTRASVSAAYHLAEILGVPIVRAIDVFKVDLRSLREDDNAHNPSMNIGNRFLRFVLDKLSQFGLNVSAMNRSPFDFAAFCPRTELKIIGGVFKEEEESMEERVEEIASLGEVMEVKPLLLGNEKVAKPQNTTFLSFDELAKITDRKKLEALL
jgi:putative transcriptional regulator